MTIWILMILPWAVPVRSRQPESEKSTAPGQPPRSTTGAPVSVERDRTLVTVDRRVGDDPPTDLVQPQGRGHSSERCDGDHRGEMDDTLRTRRSAGISEPVSHSLEAPRPRTRAVDGTVASRVAPNAIRRRRSSSNDASTTPSGHSRTVTARVQRPVLGGGVASTGPRADRPREAHARRSAPPPSGA